MDNKLYLDNTMQKEQILKKSKSLIKNLFYHSKVGLSYKSFPNEIAQEADAIIYFKFRENNLQFLSAVIPQNYNYSSFAKFINILNYNSNNWNKPPLVVSEFLSSRKRDLLKQKNVNFLDLSGNFYINCENIYLEREGFPNQYKEERKGRSPFSDKASLVIRLLFFVKDKHLGIREIAKQLNLDPGFVSRIIRVLKSKNYISEYDRKFKLVNKEDLLAEWVGNYDYKSNKIKSYFIPVKSNNEIYAQLKEFQEENAFEYALSLQAGGNLVYDYSLYNEIHIYIKNEEDLKKIQERLNLIESEKGANFFVMFPYYKNSAFFDKRLINRLWVASDLQLYLDLYNYPIRGREQAEKIFEKKLSSYIDV